MTVEQGLGPLPHIAGTRLSLVRQEPDGEVLRREDQQGGPRLLGELLEAGKVRSVIDRTLRAERGGRRSRLPRRRSRPREGRHHRVSVDADRLRDLTLELVEVESPTGDTAEVARLYGRRLEELGMEVELLDERFPATPIVIGRLRGGEPGPTVVLNGAPRQRFRSRTTRAARRRHDLRARHGGHEGRARPARPRRRGCWPSEGRSRGSS